MPSANPSHSSPTRYCPSNRTPGIINPVHFPSITPSDAVATSPREATNNQSTANEKHRWLNKEWRHQGPPGGHARDILMWAHWSHAHSRMRWKCRATFRPLPIPLHHIPVVVGDPRPSTCGKRGPLRSQRRLFHGKRNRRHPPWWRGREGIFIGRPLPFGPPEGFPPF